MYKRVKHTLGAAALLSSLLLCIPVAALADVSLHYNSSRSQNRYDIQHNRYRDSHRIHSHTRPGYGISYYSAPYYGYGRQLTPRYIPYVDKRRSHNGKCGQYDRYDRYKRNNDRHYNKRQYRD